MSAKGKNLFRIGLAVAFLAAAVLACGPTPGDGAISVVIASPGDGGTVLVGQAVMIDSAVTAAAGVDRVDLSVDGQVVLHDTPPEGNPTEFHVSQLWTPTSEGRATITVAAYDVNETSDEATLAGNGADSITAECPAGTVVVGGGFSASPEVVVSSQYPQITGWQAHVRNTSSSSKVVRVYAVCLHNTPGASIEIVQESTVMPSDGNAEVYAKCPAGSVVTGGGWRTTGADVRITQSAKTGAAWNIEAHNYSTNCMLYAHAVCLSGTGGKTSLSEVWGEVDYHWGPKEISVTCPQGTVMTGGGYRDNTGYEEFLVYINAGPWGEAPNAEWRVYALNDVGMALNPDLIVYAVCLAFP
jgi:hypothetical protein